jgi:hypothetical protein
LVIIGDVEAEAAVQEPDVYAVLLAGGDLRLQGSVGNGAVLE